MRVTGTKQQQALVKLYNDLCYRFNRHEVWQDLMWLFACSISNSIDKRYYDEREADYMRIIKKYNRDEVDLMPKLFAEIINGIEEKPDSDFLGELYMQLGLGNDHTGQVFTPYSLCRAMAEMTLTEDAVRDEIERQGYATVNDCAVGAGATLIAAANTLKDMGINYQQNVLFVGQDIDYTVALMCYIQLALHGCAGYVTIGDTLANPQTGHVLFGDATKQTWYTPMYFSGAWQLRRTAVQVDRMRRAIEAISPKNPDFVANDTGQIMFNF